MFHRPKWLENAHLNHCNPVWLLYDSDGNKRIEISATQTKQCLWHGPHNIRTYSQAIHHRLSHSTDHVFLMTMSTHVQAQIIHRGVILRITLVAYISIRFSCESFFFSSLPSLSLPPHPRIKILVCNFIALYRIDLH